MLQGYIMMGIGKEIRRKLYFKFKKLKTDPKRVLNASSMLGRLYVGRIKFLWSNLGKYLYCNDVWYSN
jgi:hypothetical protein